MGCLWIVSHHIFQGSQIHGALFGLRHQLISLLAALLMQVFVEYL